MPIQIIKSTGNSISSNIVTTIPGTTDYQPIIQSKINSLINGGEVLLDSGTFPVSSTIIIKNGVKLKGAGMGGTIIQAANNFNPTNFATNSTTFTRPIIAIDETPLVTYRATIEALQINGNRANQTGTKNIHGIYIFQKNNGSATQSLDQRHYINEVFVTECYGNGIHVSGAGQGAAFYNIRVLKINNSEFIRNEGAGMFLLAVSDSYINSCGFATNKSFGLYADGVANLLVNQSKGFYNNATLNTGGGEIMFVNSKRCKLLADEAQESYGANGFRFNNCKEFSLIGCIADSNGSAPSANGGTKPSFYPRQSGFYLFNCSRFQIKASSATDFHHSDREDSFPGNINNKNWAWQNWGLTLENCSDIDAELFSYWQFSGNYQSINPGSNVIVKINNIII
jgi:hypothetical protein